MVRSNTDCVLLPLRPSLCSLVYELLLQYRGKTSNSTNQSTISLMPALPPSLPPQSPSSPSHLLYGDESGSVTVLTFHRPLIGLFHSSGNRDEDTTTPIAYTVRLTGML